MSASTPLRWTLGAGPDEGGVGGVATDVVPDEAGAGICHAGGAGGRQSARDRVADVVDPALGARRSALDALDLDVENVTNARPAPPAVFAELDRRHARWQSLPRQRPDHARNAAGLAGEDLLECLDRKSTRLNSSHSQ